MEMSYIWLLDGAIQNLFDFQYCMGYKNLADYPSKSHTAAYHQTAHLYSVHIPLPLIFTMHSQAKHADKVVSTHQHRDRQPPYLAHVLL